MADSIGPRIEIRGETAFRQQLRDIDSGLRVNRAEMGLLSAQYDKNNESITALSEKNRVLTETIYSQTEKVNTLQAAMDSSAERYGESDKRTMAWRESLLKAETTLADLSKDLDANTEAMKRAENGASTLGDAVRIMSNVVGIQVPPALQGFIGKLDEVSASGAALVGLLAGITIALGKMTIETAKTADEILTLSSTTGMTTDSIQELIYAAEFIDVSFETIESSMTKMIRTMNSARNGSDETSKAYRKLHVRVTEAGGGLRDVNEVFYETIDRLGRIRNETERDALSMQVFGRSARDLGPLIEAGSKELREFADEAHNTGNVMDEETLRKFEGLNIAMERFSKVGDAIKTSLAQALLPILTAFFTIISQIPVEVLQTLIVLAAVIATVVLLAKAIKDLTGGISSITGAFAEMSPAAMKTTLIILGVVAALILLAIAIAFIMDKGDDMKATFNSAGNMATNLLASANATPRYARGTSFHPGGLALVGEEGPEYVDLPRGSKVYPHGRMPGGNMTVNYNVTSRNLQNVGMVYSTFERARQKERAR